MAMLCSVGVVKGVRAENFEYDKLNRLKKVVYDTGEILTYEFDANGNIKSVQRTNKDGTGTDHETSNDANKDVNNNLNQGSYNGNGSNLSGTQNNDQGQKRFRWNCPKPRTDRGKQCILGTITAPG